ncbi:MAG TPA: NAD(P)/FAD-dependent oxidoreductase [Candidatus Limnocylindria bacterium]|nr:NAD(P)/FAD-dependent oxidoreductase [Candidatus Limnocylindria bacterium]
MKRYDAIVVGAGHNGLACAAYLGLAGLKVLVLERRDVIGGMAETSELLPGVRVPTLAHTVGRLSPRVIRDLKLRAHGLELLQPNVRVFAPRQARGATVLWADATRTAAGLDANGDAYLAADRQVREWGEALADVMGRAPVDLAAPSLADVVRGLRTRARSSSTDLLRVMPMAVRDLVEEWFTSDAVAAAIAARGVLLTGLAPRMPGTAGVLLTELAGNEGGLAGQTTFARGGPGAVSDALAAAVRASGGEIRVGSAVAKVRRDGEQTRGVTLVSGDEIDATVVVSNLDPRTTLLDLVDPEALGPRLGWRAGNIRANGVTAKVNLALSGLPKFTAAKGDAQLVQGRIVIAPSLRYLDLAMRAAKYGALAEQPLLEATLPSLVDPSLVNPTGRGKATRVKHVMSVIAQAVPFAAKATEVGDAVLRTLAEYAPGIADLVVERQVITPKDIEHEYGASGGHPMHAEVALDQFYGWRPLHGFGRYRMPMHGLYLCGAGAHPGGGVTGSPGRLAAQAVLADRGRTVRP